jgi:cytochrome c5
MRRVVAFAAVAALSLAAAVPVAAQPANALPPGEGRDIVASACTSCHPLTVILALRDGPVGWKRHVDTMIMKGAQLTPREADTLLAYLNANFGPGQHMPPAKPIALPAGPGKELVESRCTMCHDLERITATKREKREWDGVVVNMLGRFGLDAPDEARTIAGYLEAHYGQ